MTPLIIDSFTATTCVGAGNESLFKAIKTGRTGLTRCDFDKAQLDTWIGRVLALDEPASNLPGSLIDYDCRNNRLAWLAIQQDGFLERVITVIRENGPSRVGLFLGTSTSGIYETELAFRSLDPESKSFTGSFSYSGSHSVSSLVTFVRELLGIEGPSFIISTACSSSAKVFATAQRYIELGLIDAAVVGGADSLCLTTLYGFNSLQLASANRCKPYDTHRDGISIGEAAAFCLITKAHGSHSECGIEFIGYGESSDAYHMSSPHPEGLGAQIAMNAALSSAGISPSEIDYINLHGTATSNNDKAEGIAVNIIFGDKTPCSSTKGITGHTLGAAGSVEAVISFIALQNQFMPGSTGTDQLDPAINLNYQVNPAHSPLKTVLTNSFGFGGSNCSLAFRASK
ncbi:MAG: beta-ketoacyl-[acyl-carrier-protein] synthase family protein [Fluviibacter sp.]